MSKKEWELVDKMMVGDFGAYHSEGTPVNDSVVTEDMSKVMDMTYGVFDEDGAWKTINGAHVYIEGGEITKGPAALTGKKSEGKSKEPAVNAKGTMTPKQLQEAETRRDHLWDKEDHNKLSEAERKELKELQGKIEEHYSKKKELMNGSTSPYTESDFGASKYKVGTKFGNISYGEAEKFFSDAPEGTKIKMDNHNTGDYVGEYTKKNGSWVGSQEYKSSYVTPPTVKTAKGFAMQVSGNDLKVISAGSGSAKKVSKSSVDVSKGFPKIVKYDGAEYYKAEEFSDGSKSYVRWDDNNNAQYITVSRKGEIERN